ncbi:unnamed protein product [Mucor circinelloides]
MLKTCAQLLLIGAILQPALCNRTERPGPDASWPIIYSSNGDSDVSSNVYDQIGVEFRRRINEYDLLPPAKEVLRYNNTSPEFLDAQFHAALCRTSNCRASFDKWDCGELCDTYLPDGEVIRSFNTFPMGVAGYIVLSHQFTNHPFIKGAKVQQGLLAAEKDIYQIVQTALYDQLLLTPDYKVDVTGHSFGAGVGSLLVADLNHRHELVNSTNLSGHLFGKTRVGSYEYAAYFKKENLDVRRYVQEGDDIIHVPDIRDGYVHEGDEYWLENDIIQEMVVCPGPFETRDCSNKVKYTKATQHLLYWNIVQNCESDFNNII